VGDALEVADPYIMIPAPLIPIYYGWPHPMGDSTRSDYWYATIHGDDDIADVALGRFSVWAWGQLARVIDKTFAYERYPDESNWLIEKHDLVSCSQGTSPDPREYHGCKLRVGDILTQAGFEYYDDWGEWTHNNDVISHINNTGTLKGVSLINYRGHGEITAWAKGSSGWNIYHNRFTNDHIRQLTNFSSLEHAWLPIVFEICCCCGRAGQNLPDTTGHSECWFRWVDGGGVAALGASRPTYTKPNHLFDELLYRLSFGQGPMEPVTQELGWVINTAKAGILETYPWDDPYALANIRTYHLMGDPEIDIYTDWHGYINAYHISTTTDIPQYYTVEVRDANMAPLPDAVVCLFQDKENSIHEVQLTDEDGMTSFWITPEIGILYVTVTKTNYGPYEGECRVLAGPKESLEKAGAFTFNCSNVIHNSHTQPVHIDYQLPEQTRVDISVYEASGRLINIVKTGPQNAGEHHILWKCQDTRGRTVSNGVYFMHLTAGDHRATKKVVILN
jgi:hypothetical protein